MVKPILKDTIFMKNIKRPIRLNPECVSYLVKNKLREMLKSAPQNAVDEAEYSALMRKGNELFL